MDRDGVPRRAMALLPGERRSVGLNDAATGARGPSAGTAEAREMQSDRHGRKLDRDRAPKESTDGRSAGPELRAGLDRRRPTAVDAEVLDEYTRNLLVTKVWCRVREMGLAAVLQELPPSTRFSALRMSRLLADRRRPHDSNGRIEPPQGKATPPKPGLRVHPSSIGAGPRDTGPHEHRHEGDCDPPDKQLQNSSAAPVKSQNSARSTQRHTSLTAVISVPIPIVHPHNAE